MSSKPGLEPDEEPSPLSAEAATTAVDAQPHVVDPTGIGARLRQLQDTSRGAQLSWQEYTGHEHSASSYFGLCIAWRAHIRGAERIPPFLNSHRVSAPGSSPTEEGV